MGIAPQYANSSSSQPGNSRFRFLVYMFTDIVNSLGSKEAFTTTVYVTLLARHDALVRQAVTLAGGHVQQDTGDGVFATFAKASDAVIAALQFQFLMEAEPWPKGQKLRSRVGISLGEAAEVDTTQDGGNKLVGCQLISQRELCISHKAVRF